MLTARNQLNRYGSSGTLKIPQDNGTYDPNTGDTTVIYDDHNILYVPWPVSTDNYGNFGLDAFQGSFLTFMLKDVDDSVITVPTTAYIDDINGNRIDIQEVHTLKIKDTIVLFEARTVT